jgi:hypothetical protein
MMRGMGELVPAWRTVRTEGIPIASLEGGAMTASRRVLAGFWVLAILGSLGSTASAQDFVPGGWAPQFGFKAFNTPGVSGGFGMFSYDSSGMVTVAIDSGFGGQFPLGGVLTPSLQPAGPPEMANGLVPLANTVRRQTRRRTAR